MRLNNIGYLMLSSCLDTTNRLDDIGMESKVSIGVWLSLDVSILDVRFHCVETWHQQV